MTKKSWTNSALFAAFLLGATSCASSPKETKPTINAQEQERANELITEMEVGRAMTGRLLAAYGVDEAKSLNNYVAVLGSYLSENSEWAARRFSFAITEDSSVSAFSAPGGFVLASKGSILFAQNEAELAGVLAHEISHIGRKHVVSMIKKRSTDTSVKQKDPDPGLDLRKREQSSTDSKAGGALARYLSGPGGTSISIFAAASSGLSTLLKDGLDKEMEFEADADALKVMTKAGYNGRAYINYLTRLEKETGKDTAAVLDKTHPPLKDRVSRLIKLNETFQAEYPSNALGKERFQKIIATLGNANATKKQ
jgi:predicted Zn-dependent protease